VILIPAATSRSERSAGLRGPWGGRRGLWLASAARPAEPNQAQKKFRFGWLCGNIEGK